MSHPMYQEIMRFTQQNPRMPFILATVVEAVGATPRGIGASMALAIDKQAMLTWGTIGGGCVEGEVKQASLQLFQSQEKIRVVNVSLMGAPGDKSEDVCGGSMKVLLEKFTPGQAEIGSQPGHQAEIGSQPIGKSGHQAEIGSQTIEKSGQAEIAHQPIGKSGQPIGKSGQAEIMHQPIGKSGQAEIVHQPIGKSKLTLLVMAAGIGSRYGGTKQIEPIGPTGEIIVDYSVSDASAAGFDHVVLIIRPDLQEQFEPIVARWKKNFGIQISYVYQELTKNLPAGFQIPSGRVKPWGTCHAILCAKDIIKTPFAAINADDYYGPESYQVLAQFLRNVKPDENKYAMVAYLLSNTLSEHGPVSRGVCQEKDGLLERVIEHTKLELQNGQLYSNGILQSHLNPNMPVSMNFWGFTPTIFEWLAHGFHEFLQTMPDPLKSEYYIPLAVDQGLSNHHFTVSMLHSPAKWVGITYKEDVPFVRKFLPSLNLGIWKK